MLKEKVYFRSGLGTIIRDLQPELSRDQNQTKVRHVKDKYRRDPSSLTFHSVLSLFLRAAKENLLAE